MTDGNLMPVVSNETLSELEKPEAGPRRTTSLLSRRSPLAEPRCQIRALEAVDLDNVPSAGNFVLVEMGQDAAAIYDALLRRSVIVRPVANYGLDQHLRISIGTTSENDRLLDALSQVLGPGDEGESDGG